MEVWKFRNLEFPRGKSRGLAIQKFRFREFRQFPSSSTFRNKFLRSSCDKFHQSCVNFARFTKPTVSRNWSTAFYFYSSCIYKKFEDAGVHVISKRTPKEISETRQYNNFPSSFPPLNFIYKDAKKFAWKKSAVHLQQITRAYRKR